MTVGAAGGGLGELSAGLGVAEVVSVIVALGLDVLSTGIVVVPLVPPQAAARRSSATNPPSRAPRPRLAFCFPAAAGMSGSEPESEAVGVVTAGQFIAT